jgi:uncharacterized protein DUF3226
MSRMLLKREDPEITSNNILLIEGSDEVNFFTELLIYMGLNSGLDIQTRAVGGKNNFRYELPAFLNDSNFYRVTAYAIIRDADTSAKNTLKSVQKLLDDLGQPYPQQSGEFASNDKLKVGIFVLPGSANTGMLEDLCLRSVENHPIMPHVNEYLKQVEVTMGAKAPKNKSKAKLQAFLAGMQKIDERLGMAAKWKYWPFDHEAFTPIHNFIEELISPLSAVHVPDQIDLVMSETQANS